MAGVPASPTNDFGPQPEGAGVHGKYPLSAFRPKSAFRTASAGPPTHLRVLRGRDCKGVESYPTERLFLNVQAVSPWCSSRPLCGVETGQRARHVEEPRRESEDPDDPEHVSSAVLPGACPEDEDNPYVERERRQVRLGAFFVQRELQVLAMRFTGDLPAGESAFVTIDGATTNTGVARTTG